MEAGCVTALCAERAVTGGKGKGRVDARSADSLPARKKREVWKDLAGADRKALRAAKVRNWNADMAGIVMVFFCFEMGLWVQKLEGCCQIDGSFGMLLGWDYRNGCFFHNCID